MRWSRVREGSKEKGSRGIELAGPLRRGGGNGHAGDLGPGKFAGVVEIETSGRRSKQVTMSRVAKNVFMSYIRPGVHRPPAKMIPNPVSTLHLSYSMKVFCLFAFIHLRIGSVEGKPSSANRF